VRPPSLPAADAATQAARAGHVLAGLSGAWPVDVAAAGDLLHEPARFAQMPASGAAVAELRSAGIHAWLSGAGPSVAAAIPARDDWPLAAISDVARRHGFTPLAGRFELSGALSCPEDGCGLAGVPGCVQCPRRRV
jgi:homoserine kinase